MDEGNRGEETMLSKKELDKARAIIEKAGRVLVALPFSGSPDHLAAAELILLHMRRLEKEISISPTAPFPHELSPLPFAALERGLAPSRDLSITLDTDSYPINELRYEKENGMLVVLITPKERSIPPEAVKVKEAGPKADAIITVGLNTLSDLGDFFEKNPRLFFETPIVALGISESHDRHGEANLVDATRSAVAEIAWELIREIGETPLSRRDSTLVLAGIYSNNKGAHRVPETLRLIAECLEAGAEETAVKQLFRTMPTLKEIQLAGRAAARTREEGTLLLSLLTSVDFLVTRTSAESIGSVASSLAQFAEGKLILLLWQHPITQKINFCLKANNQELENKISELLQGQWGDGVFFGEETFLSFESAENALLSRVRPLVK